MAMKTNAEAVPSDASADLPASVVEEVARVAASARIAARRLAVMGADEKNTLLRTMADRLVSHAEKIAQANQGDLERGRASGMSETLLDRLRLDRARIEAIAEALREVAALPDPVGQVVRGSVLPNGLRLRQIRVPMGVVGMVYEARPNVTVDAAGLAIKSGNAVILRGGSAAADSNVAIVDVLREALVSHGVEADAVQTIDALGRDGARALMRARGLVDLLVPRGGAGLIHTVVREAVVPVIETGVGNCHVYVDATADVEEALAIVLNAKTQRPSVCNAAETLLVHADLAERFVPAVVAALGEAGVTVHADERAAGLAPASAGVLAATEEDWAKEYLSLDMAVRVVDSLDAAVRHILEYSSGHTEAICTRELAAAEEFVARIDSSTVIVNASTRFTDGGQFGLGAEIGISTQKLHARGPMGLGELTTTKWVVWGDGHIRT